MFVTSIEPEANAPMGKGFPEVTGAPWYIKTRSVMVGMVVSADNPALLNEMVVMDELS